MKSINVDGILLRQKIMIKKEMLFQINHLYMSDDNK